MPPVPAAERPPEGLDAWWLGVWRGALKALKEQGSWAWQQRPLLDEYVFALIAAQSARDDEDAGVWDRHVRRASVLADQLALTPRGRKAVGVGEESDGNGDPLQALDDELAKRRARAG
ncbi:MAG: hypothetical protein NVSMB60_25780 [Mycobacterium sp.]